MIGRRRGATDIMQIRFLELSKSRDMSEKIHLISLLLRRSHWQMAKLENIIENFRTGSRHQKIRHFS
ncbi:hypothetical protein RIR_jg3380.t1 [Rhizophagus irregularis DAOM 181602=DAOM 197198]|nr:hypothetical protein RIR_jg3380.t1 [Rhizophagus irregularis DAOM 181602=DAOM 197198]